MATQFALCPEDREKYGGPEWVTWDKDALDDIPFSVIDPIEQQIKELYKVSIGEFLAVEFLKGTLRGYQVIAWLSRQIEAQRDPALAEPSLAEFEIKPRKMRIRVKPGTDVVPPALASSAPSPEGAPSATLTTS